MASPEHELRFEMDEAGSYRVTLGGEFAGFVTLYPDERRKGMAGEPWKWTVCRPFVERTVAGRTRTLAEARRAVASVLPKKETK